MSASLVGSEMCIRDSRCTECRKLYLLVALVPLSPLVGVARSTVVLIIAVSYTHLTLPTICSV
eukprot:4084531-Alexandrium_andersonii.AAC.1